LLLVPQQNSLPNDPYYFINWISNIELLCTLYYISSPPWLLFDQFSTICLYYCTILFFIGSVVEEPNHFSFLWSSTPSILFWHVHTRGGRGKREFELVTSASWGVVPVDWATPWGSWLVERIFPYNIFPYSIRKKKKKTISTILVGQPNNKIIIWYKNIYFIYESIHVCQTCP